MRPLNYTQEADAMYRVTIVLANLMDADGTLNDESQARLDLACRMYVSGKTEKILLMGWDYRDDSSLCISDAMNVHLQKHYTIKFDDVLIDRSSRDTVGDAIFSICNFNFLLNGKNACVVTSDYHVRRTEIIFKFIYGREQVLDVLGIPTDRCNEMAQAEEDSLQAFYQTFLGMPEGKYVKLFNAMIERHPYYNGIAYPKVPGFRISG